MKKLFSILALTALVLGLPSGSSAEEEKPAAPAAATPTAASKLLPFHIQVATIDAAGKTFTHKNKGDGKELKYTLTDKSVIKNGSAPAKLEDIKVGDFVSGSYLKKGDNDYEVVKITKFGPAVEKKAKTN